MLLMIIYLLGLIPGFLALLDVASQKNLTFMGKVGLGFYVLFFSWVGYFTYYFVIRYFIVNKGHLEAEE